MGWSSQPSTKRLLEPFFVSKDPAEIKFQTPRHLKKSSENTSWGTRCLGVQTPGHLDVQGLYEEDVFPEKVSLLFLERGPFGKSETSLVEVWDHRTSSPGVVCWGHPNGPKWIATKTPVSIDLDIPPPKKYREALFGLSKWSFRYLLEGWEFLCCQIAKSL